MVIFDARKEEYKVEKTDKALIIEIRDGMIDSVSRINADDVHLQVIDYDGYEITDWPGDDVKVERINEVKNDQI